MMREIERTYRFIMTAMLVLFTGVAVDAQIVINEVMQSNIDCIMDDQNEFPDSWVELYNSGKKTIDMRHYRIGVSPDFEKAWDMPAQSMTAGLHILVYCDKVAYRMHTDFRLDSGKGGCVYLFNREGEVVDSVVNMKKQPAPNISYGRVTDGADEWGYQLKPTPESANCGEVTSNILGEPVFSKAGCVVTDGSNIRLTIKVPDDAPQGTVVRFTTDGSEPTETSGILNSAMNISKTTLVRAKLFCKGWLSPRSTTHSYIYHPRTQTLPVVSIVTDKRYLYDSKVGIYVSGDYRPGTSNFSYDWRRPINFEMFETDGNESVINQLCETRIQGGASRSTVRKSFAVYAHKRFGTKQFKYEFFPDQKPGLDKFKSILLRNAGNDFDYLYMRDIIIQRTMSANVDLDWQAWRPAIVYLNGEYTGILNIRERSNDDNVYSNYDELEDIDMLENWWDLKAGDKVNFDAFTAFYNEHGHTMAEYAEWMDCIEFINLMIMNLFYCNLDFPGNNIIMWRPRTEDGKWRWIAKDTDFGLGLYGRRVDYNTIEWLHNNNYDPDNAWANTSDATRLFRRLMEDEDFKREFIDRCAIYMGDFMNAKGTLKHWLPMYDVIKSEYKYHRNLINQWWPNYDSEMESAKKWIEKRPGVFYNMLKDYYKLGNLFPLTVNKEMEEAERNALVVRVNGVQLSEALLDGLFYTGRTLSLEGECTDGQVVKGWKKSVTLMDKNRTVETTTVPGSSISFTVPACSSLSLEAIVGEDDGVAPVFSDQSAAQPRIYNINGVQQSGIGRGINIIRMGDGTAKVVRLMP